jgi:hypothetical protein
MRPFTTVAELGAYIQLLQASALDRFSMTVFERPLGERLTDAHAPRRDAPEMSAQRRRLKNLSREYVRPGMHVADMHESSCSSRGRGSSRRTRSPRSADRARRRRRRGSASMPTSPRSDRASGDRSPGIPPHPAARAYTRRSRGGVGRVRQRRRACTLRARLAELGLDGLRPSSRAAPPEDQVAAEFDFAWWQSALEVLLRSDRALLGANTAVVDRLERDFRLVDEAHAGSAGPPGGRTGDEVEDRRRRRSARGERPQARAVSGATTPAELVGAAPALVRTLAPVWLASPLRGADDPVTAPLFDVVIVMLRGAVPSPRRRPRRAAQVVAFGDPVTQKPTPFVGAGAPQFADEPDPTSRSTTSACSSGSPRSFRSRPDPQLPRGGEDLAELVNSAFYDGVWSRRPGQARTSGAAASASITSRAAPARPTRSPAPSRARMPRSPAS